jgi:hypothetical protein
VGKSTGFGLGCRLGNAGFELCSIKRNRVWFSLWIVFCCLCSGRVGRETGVGIVCEMYIAGCVVLEWEEGRGCFRLWFGYFWLCS